ncbi:alpha/beta hydrolase-fold protein [Shewanella cyperi]|uniref:alpha/beta hydrolase-fold protein n=1 Tax=Shewanella cyperi TaxID=2814292 RepID=UPI001A94EA48|nr:alpha/beta hydrolase-fold protein [Shewanella cyperi]QSX40941.1 hypothetical protein JYB84_00345 [Shewanella cyperi]
MKFALTSIAIRPLLALLLTLVAGAAQAGRVETLSVKNEAFTEAAEFRISLPDTYDSQSDKRYVVLLDLHPRAANLLAGMEDWMSHNGDWPWLETIIVTAPDSHQGLGKLKQAAIEQGDGQLLDFIERGLLPAIEAKYRSNGFKIMSGFTGNGGLVLYTLLNRPELFNAYLAASPVLGQDFAKVLQDAEPKLKAMASRLEHKPRFLQISTSDSDFEQGQLAPYAELEAKLKAFAPAGLKWQSKRFDGSYYMTQAVLATAHGIEFIFDDIHRVLAPDSAISQKGAEAIIRHYQQLSTDVYGFEVSPADSLIALGQSLKQSAPQQARAVYESGLASLPKSASLHFELGQLLGEQGDKQGARKELQLALANTDHPFWQKYYGDALAKIESGAAKE